MPDAQTHARPGRVPALVFLAAGIALIAGAAAAYFYIVQRPQNWPRALATVVSSRVVNPQNPSQHQPEIAFRYDADGTARDITIVSSWSSSSYDSMRQYVDRYPPGAMVPLALNPSDPSDVRYELGPTFVNLMAPGIVGTLGVIFTAIGLLTLRARRRETPTPARNAAVLRRVATTFTIIGAVLLGLGIWLFARDAAMLREWPTVDAEVTDVALVTRSTRSQSGPSARLFDVQVTFTYEAGGKRFESQTTTGVASTSRDRAAGLLKQYAKGTHHPIRHRPDDPNVIRFDVSRVSIFAAAGGLTLMGLVFLGFGLRFLKTGPKPHQLQR